jgi:hypothetical protein
LTAVNIGYWVSSITQALILRRSNEFQTSGQPWQKSLEQARASANFRQKKAQPLGAALKVPPKEEVLEECAGTWRRRARSQYANFPAVMQAFSAAVQNITMTPRKTKLFSTNQ